MVTPEASWSAGEAVLAKAETRALYQLIRRNTLGLVDVRVVDAQSGENCLDLEPHWPRVGDDGVSTRACVLSFGDEGHSNGWRNLQASAGLCSAVGYLPCFTNLGGLPAAVSGGLAAYRDFGSVIDAVCGPQEG